jgi:flavodoxin
MGISLIYDTNHNRTKAVVDRLPFWFKFPYTVSHISVADLSDLVIIFCPTYGDEELPLGMEDFLLELRVSPKKFVICELGNYYGYDNYQFGALKIIKGHLMGLGWEEFFKPLSLDSLPQVNWEALEKWAKEFNIYVHECFLEKV